MQESNYFKTYSMILLNQEHRGDTNERLSFADPREFDETQYYDKVGNWIYKWFKKHS